ncbi:MAG: 50S ribosomal protein L4 [Candidatus Doudnabacteria bacterium CG10_big_fil_rev_8_21_14_0_10_42_18]|uniref:Large ribosomal subunit protein uL4 n=1 Tax=Candidatus Doudnabacteria bacterium CG10_big_fil_rev_8_21_14_0_10_42_18 TaxID=1974552 RepID=A0A2H0VBF5_9BACT|nr:MAG: 50S ribosomal protein L4 [Candidatus Doudnabacteria bacterium CG10_big_fil_rev_8_21_14_0_10_42_18]
MKTSVYNQKGEVVGEVALNPAIFEVKAKPEFVAEVVRMMLSNARQGTSSTKTRGEVRGGGKKPWKQKGTGRARVGSIRSPIWRHGGITFGPRANQNWKLKINKKAKQKAMIMSLSDKVLNNRFFVVDSVVFEKPKTKEFVKLLGALKNTVKDMGKNQIFLIGKQHNNLVRASRNIPSVEPVLAKDLNILDVLKAGSLIVMKDALGVLEKQYVKKVKVKS